jgi:hypothetical protein
MVGVTTLIIVGPCDGEAAVPQSDRGGMSLAQLPVTIGVRALAADSFDPITAGNGSPIGQVEAGPSSWWRQGKRMWHRN